jgi:hypothetical protein
MGCDCTVRRVRSEFRWRWNTRPLTLFLSGSTVNIETSCLAFPDRVDQRREVNDRPIPQGATRHRLNLLSEC